MFLVFGTSLNVTKVIFLPSPGNWKNPLVLETMQSSHHFFLSVTYLRHLGPHKKDSFSTCRNVMGEKESVLSTAPQNRGSCTFSYKWRKERCHLLWYWTCGDCNWSWLYVVLQTQLVHVGKRTKACVWCKAYWEEKGSLEGLPLSSPSWCLEIPLSPALHICLFLVSFSYLSCASHSFGMLLTFLIV